MKQIQRAYKKADGMYGDWEDITVEQLCEDSRQAGEFDYFLAMEKLCDAQLERRFLQTRYAFYRFKRDEP
jgi:hypothetical protein